MTVRFDLETTFLGMDGAGKVAMLPVGPDFWETIDENPEVGSTMVSMSVGQGDWAHWEIHPKGDEVLVLIGGSLRVIFDRDGREEAHDMTPGATLIVPAGVWHRAVNQRDARMLFMTYGEGTQHRPVQA
jgi:mannose-6-phosphate isomerase-like protein (cupin superfamily)